MRKNLIIVGTGGLAREVAVIVDRINSREHRWEFLGFVGRSLSEGDQNLGFGKVIGTDHWLMDTTFPCDLVIAIGNPKVKAEVVDFYKRMDFEFPNIIDPSAQLGHRIEMGRGNVVQMGSVFTSDIRLGDFNLINGLCFIGHDCELGDCNTVNHRAGLSGCTKIGHRVLFGAGATTVEGHRIGSDAIVGAGAVITKDVMEGTTVVGVPARER
jgi:sugar O-acyltransferase (sialic acid O-acetyltransferase NeuD family)